MEFGQGLKTERENFGVRTERGGWLTNTEVCDLLNGEPQGPKREREETIAANGKSTSTPFSGEKEAQIDGRFATRHI